jgi:hypothetical protein
VAPALVDVACDPLLSGHEESSPANGDAWAGAESAGHHLESGAQGLSRRNAGSRAAIRMSVAAAIAVGAVIGLVLGILVSVTTDVPLAPEAGLLLGALTGWISRRDRA